MTERRSKGGPRLEVARERRLVLGRDDNHPLALVALDVDRVPRGSR